MTTSLVDGCKFGEVDIHTANDRDRNGTILSAGDVQSKQHHGLAHKGEVLQLPGIYSVLCVQQLQMLKRKHLK